MKCHRGVSLKGGIKEPEKDPIAVGMVIIAAFPSLATWLPAML